LAHAYRWATDSFDKREEAEEAAAWRDVDNWGFSGEGSAQMLYAP
jgi:hypothetical protein